MKRLARILFLFVNWYCVSANWKIINGTQSGRHEFPEIVAILSKKGLFCGGTLLNGNTVLTAAHCVYQLKNWTSADLYNSGLQVVFGEHDLKKKNPYEKRFKVLRLVIHKTFYMVSEKEFGGTDVALMKFAGFICKDQYPHIKYTRLDTDSISKPGDRCEVAGWGNMLPKKPCKTRYLRRAAINILSNSDCSEALGAEMNQYQICAGSGRMSTSACQGDSGGPLFCTDSFNRRVQVGIVSYGQLPCGLPNKPTVYTRISDILNWILVNSKYFETNINC